MSVNINDLLARAAALRDETALNSISPDRAGGIMYDTLLAMNELWLQQGSALVISKIYASVAAMEADSAPVSDLTGQPLRPGQIVVIASSDSDNGSVYRYDGTEDDTSSWSEVGAIGGVPVVDSLDSDSSTLPLAARQGKALKQNLDDMALEEKKRYTKFTLVEASDLTLIGDGYMNYDFPSALISPMTLVAWSGAKLYYYPVQAGRIYKISSDIVWNEHYSAVGFSNSLPELEGTYDLSLLLSDAAGEDYFTPERDGYIILCKRNNQWSHVYTPSEISLSDMQSDISVAQSAIDTLEADTAAIEELLNVQEYRGGELPNGFVVEGTVELPGSYLTSTGTIAATTSERYLKAYPVQAGQKVNVFGSMGPAMSLAACGFCEATPEIGVTNVQVLAALDGDIDETFTCPANGYLLCYHRGISYFCLGYEVIKVASPQFGVNSLSSKTIAVLGDSIMQLMGGPVFTDNVVTLKNYDDPEDTTVYQASEATVVRGIIYLTSSLNDGEPDENSIRLEIVNSKQAEIDSRGWDDLQNKLDAKKVINCGLGGGRITEMGVVTAYPSRSSNVPYEGNVESLPNQVRMLIRLVSDGTYDAPACIVIWMGVNGTTLAVGDLTFDDAMAIPWETLSDDVAGYTYRTKFFGALRYAIEALYRAFPYATICVATPVQNNNGDLNYADNDPRYRGYTNLAATRDNMKVVAERYACLFFNALNEIGIANFSYKATESSGISTGTRLGNLIPIFLKDGLHPSEAGKIVWCHYLISKLNSSFFSKL